MKLKLAKTNTYSKSMIAFALMTLLVPFTAAASAPSKINHIAFIPDGNRRWAEENNLDPTDGHKEGFLNTTPKVIEDLWNMGIHTVTIWCFSTENWNRNKQEVENLMEYIDQLSKKMLSIAKKWKAKIVHLGRKDRAPAYLLETLSFIEKETSSFTEHIVNFAIDFGGRNEITRACQKVHNSKGNLDIITEEDLNSAMDTADQPFPFPDLIVRTAGEKRLSGFMSWQSTYSELYFTPKYYPALNRHDLEEAIESFNVRQRRYGK